MWQQVVYVAIFWNRVEILLSYDLNGVHSHLAIGTVRSEILFERLKVR